MDDIIKDLSEGQEYKEGFVTELEQEFAPKGLNEDIIRFISAKKNEPEWLLEFRLGAYRRLQSMTPPTWGHLRLPKIDLQEIIYWAAPKTDKDRPKEIDPKLMETFEKLGIPLHEREVLAGVKPRGEGIATATPRNDDSTIRNDESTPHNDESTPHNDDSTPRNDETPQNDKNTTQNETPRNDDEAIRNDDEATFNDENQTTANKSNVAIDAVFDSVSVATTFRKTLAEKGIIFCSFSEAVQQHPELVRKYLASVVPVGDNYYAALNSAVFSDGSFCYIPKGVKCPMDLSSYFRINASGTGQFERTLIIADEGAKVSYMEGCTAPMRDEHQLHAAVVEIIVEKDADVKYSTVQNWYPGDAQGRGGILNLVTKRGICKGSGSHLSWTQVETGSAITWKYPSTILKGDNSSSEFYSVAMTGNMQQADTGTKMIHLGRNTRSRIVSKGISSGASENSYRGLVHIAPGADNSRNFSQCDSLLIGSNCGAHTFPVIKNHNQKSVVEHEATTSKISEDQLFYCAQRGIGPEDAVGMIVGGYAKEVLSRLPMEFAIEAQKLLSVSLEGSVG